MKLDCHQFFFLGLSNDWVRLQQCVILPTAIICTHIYQLVMSIYWKYSCSLGVLSHEPFKHLWFQLPEEIFSTFQRYAICKFIRYVPYFKL